MAQNYPESYDAPVEVTKGVYWVGAYNPERSLQCNPYLLVDGEEAVLFDPGGVNSYSQVAAKCFSIVEPVRIRYVVLHHQDPDLAACVPLLEEIIDPNRVKIVTHSRAGILLSDYGIKSTFYLVDRNHWTLPLKSGRTLRFLMTPFCHFPAAIVTYDEQEKVLFSSDLFGAITQDWSLFAGEGYEEQMRSFHVGYMASARHLSNVIKRIAPLELKWILPQHGSILHGNIIPRSIDFLKSLPCGIDALESEEEWYGWITAGKVEEKRLILIVDDDAKNMILLRDILEISGYRIIEAVNGNEAVEKARLEKPDLILMDIQMPVMDGLEATKLIKAGPDTQGISVIALTAFAMSGDKENFIKAGCDDCLSKPLDIKGLLFKVKHFLGEGS